jgi:hypothetical protein
MPYYIYIVTNSEATGSRSVSRVGEFETFKTAKSEVRRLRTEDPLADNQAYKIIFAEDAASAEKNLKEVREQPIAREWEK